jgi:hypothetical protein
LNLREVTNRYGSLVVFIRYHSAEIWGFQYVLALGIGTLKIMARTGVFMLVVYALKHSISWHGGEQSIILTFKKHKQSRSYQKNDLSKEFQPGRQRTKKNRTPTENSGRLDKIEYLDD